MYNIINYNLRYNNYYNHRNSDRTQTAAASIGALDGGGGELGCEEPSVNR